MFIPFKINYSILFFMTPTSMSYSNNSSVISTFISDLDLGDVFASLVKNKSDESIQTMLNEASGPMNFTMFLTLFGTKMNGTDSEDCLRNAFSCFDEKGTGYIPEVIFYRLNIII